MRSAVCSRDSERSAVISTRCEWKVRAERVFVMDGDLFVKLMRVLFLESTGMFKDFNISRDLNTAFYDWSADRDTSRAPQQQQQQQESTGSSADTAVVASAGDASVSRSLPPLAPTDLSVNVLTMGTPLFIAGRDHSCHFFFANDVLRCTESL